jgi:hypothetical protein
MIKINFTNDGQIEWANEVEQIVKIWPHLLATVNWIVKKEHGPMSLTFGNTITCINNLAFAVEGYIEDLVITHNEQTNDPKILKNDGWTWKHKKIAYDEVFHKKLDEYSYWDGIQILFYLRNNFAHARVYTEVVRQVTASDDASEIESDNQEYNNVIGYLKSKELLTDFKTMSNYPLILKPEIVTHFSDIVKIFVEAILDENELKYIEDIKREFNEAYEI